MKLNIQMFSSTNKTTNLELSQYIGTDKPTYLGDYNSDMGKIDTAVHGNSVAISEVSGNYTNLSNRVGTLSDLGTTDKTSIVNAVNEVNTNTNSNTTNIGSLSNLETSNKSTIVNAINSVVEKFNMSDITNYSTGTLDDGSHQSDLIACDITVAMNSDKSICKIYGQVATNNGNNSKLTLPTSFDVDSAFYVNYVGTKYNRTSFTLTGFGGITFNANGTISLDIGNGVAITKFDPVVIFVKSFND